MPPWAEWVGFGLATVGAVLGVMSTWAGLTRDRPRLKVRPVWVLIGQGGRASARTPDAVERYPEGHLGIEVINTGYVTVYVSEVGVCPGRFLWHYRFREFSHPAGRAAITSDLLDQFRMPHELVPGASMLVTGQRPASYLHVVANARSAYAMTSDERRFVGRTRLLSVLANEARKAIAASR